MECDVAPAGEGRVGHQLSEDVAGNVMPGANVEAATLNNKQNDDPKPIVNDGAGSSIERTADKSATTTQSEKRPIEVPSSTCMNNSFHIDLGAHQKKVAKTVEETGAWNCSNGLCNEEDDSFMFTCKSCSGVCHYRCTNLPLYEIARYLGPGRRVYECVACVKIPEKLKTYRMRSTEVINKSSGTRVHNSKVLVKDITALEKDIIDKDFLIRSQKEIIEKIRTQTQASIEESIENNDAFIALKAERDELLENAKEQSIELAIRFSEIRSLKSQIESRINTACADGVNNSQSDINTEAWQNIKVERDELLVLVKQKDKEIGECSVIIENLKKKIEGKEVDECSTDLVMNETALKLAEMTDRNHDLTRRLEEKNTLVGKMESLVESKQDVVDAKAEVIDNLKTIITIMKSEKEVVINNEPSDMTSNVTSGGESVEVETPAVKNGVTESCEFLQIHGANGVIMNPFLLWVDIQRKMNPENVWKESALEKFASTEITEAKEILWRVAGQDHIGKIVKRQGSSKSTSEISDICGGLNKLVEKDKLPLFVCTSGMVASTPIYTGGSPGINQTDVGDHLKKIDESIKKTLNEITKSMETKLAKDDEPASNSDEAAKHIDTPLCDTIPIDDTVPRQGDRSEREPWTHVPRRRQSMGNEKPLPSHMTHLVVSNVDLDVRGLQIVQFLENKDISVTDWDLLTTRDDASFLTYRITVSKADAEKLKDDSLWPGETQFRPFKPSKKQNSREASGRRPGNRSRGTNTGENSDRRNHNTDSKTMRQPLFLPVNNHRVNVYPTRTAPTEFDTSGIIIPGNMYGEGTYADVVSQSIPWNEMQQSSTHFGRNVPVTMMRNPVGQRASMDALNREHQRNTQFVSNAPGVVERNRVGQYADIINGRDNSTGTSYPGNANRGPSWSEVCHPPRVRFVDRIGVDQFIQ